ncbi:hypothetical protein [Chitinibacter sp. S2-10]|uniref:hypothetical protein n=1 Tax=Chitinibacter sp. S2-10 TaxID=3373597 RepID=UPI0039772ED9
MQFDEVKPEHFTTLSATPFPHVLIERALLQMVPGTNPLEGPKFRNEVMQAAGWKHSNVVSFGKYPADAAAAFNRIREALEESDTPSAVLLALTRIANKKTIS